MTNPLVSVIVPAWNLASYLHETLQSVQAQSYQNYEVLMVDDGSTDVTFGIMQAWAKRDSRFITIRQPSNQGVVAARNAALAVAVGEYVAMLDGDDIWAPNALSIRIGAADSFPEASVISTDFAWFDDSISPDATGRVRLGPKARGVFDEAYASGRPTHLKQAFDVVAELHFAWTGATLVRRDKMVEVGNFDPTFDGPEDTLLWLALANNGAFVFLPEITAYYRQRAGSLVHSQRKLKEFHYLKVLDHVLEKPGYAKHRKTIVRIMSECCAVCAIEFRCRNQWNSALAYALRGLRLDPLKANHWRNLIVATLKR